MTDKPAPRRPEGPDGLQALGRDYLRRHGLGKAFEEGVQGFFVDAVTRQYWEPIRQYFARNHCSLKQAGEAAGVNRSTVSRLVRDVTSPSFPTLCQMFARLGLDMKGVRFPGGREALWQAFFLTVEHVRTRLPAEERGERGAASFDYEQWECLRLAVAGENARATLKAAAEGQAERLTATGGLVVELGRRFPAGCIRDAAAVEQVFRDWLIPWVLFCTVIPLGEGGRP